MHMTLEQGGAGCNAAPANGYETSLDKVSGGFKGSEAKQFLELLGKDPSTTWLQAIGGGADHQGVATAADRRWINSKTADRRNIYARIGNADAVTGDKGGMLDADVTGVPAFFVEWDDGADIETQAQRWEALGLPEPTVMVSTGGKSVHCYWVLREPLEPVQWRAITARLITHCKGDPACKNPSRLMRLPGSVYFDKKTGEPTGECRIIAAAGTRYAVFDIETALPAPAKLKPVKAAPKGEYEPRPEAELIAALERVPEFRHDEGRRKELLGLTQRLTMEWGLDRAHQWMAQHSPTIKDLAGYFAKEPDQINAGSIWPWLNEHYGVELKRSKGSSLSAQGAQEQQSPSTGNAPKPVTFEDRWQELETHAAEIACSDWPVMKAVASLGHKASDLDVNRLTSRNLEQLLEQAHRAIRAKSEPIQGGGTFNVKTTPWAVDGLFRHGLNLLVGQSGAGKSRLAAACMAAWLRGDQTWLSLPLNGIEQQHRHALIVGSDQTLEDWAITLEPVGLCKRLDAETVQIHPNLTLYGLETGIGLDADGLATIRRWVDHHPGGMLVVDSLSSCLPPGIDEDSKAAGRPVRRLQEVLGDAWGILTHHTRKGAGKEGNLGVGAGRGSGDIDAAVSRVIGLGLIHKMENGILVPQEADDRRELLSTKRGGKTLHLVVKSDATGYWSNEGSAEALKQQERQERVVSNLTEHQSDLLALLEATDGWLTVKDLVEGAGDEYEAKGAKAAFARKVLKRLEVLGLVESIKTGNERTYRTKVNHPRGEEKELTGSTGSPPAIKGFSLVHQVVHHGSPSPGEPVGEPPTASEPVNWFTPLSEPAGEPVKPQSPQQVNQLNHLPPTAVKNTGSPAPSGYIKTTIPGFIAPITTAESTGSSWDTEAA